MKSEYTKQAEKFLKETKTSFKYKYYKNDVYFPDDRESRDIYKITLKNPKGIYIFTFGTSINDTQLGKEPEAYDILAGLTKYAPGDFNNFCYEFGCNVDSRKAKKTYNAVVKEWQNVQKLFTGKQLNELAEIG